MITCREGGDGLALGRCSVNMRTVVTFRGHVWTIYPWLKAQLRPPHARDARPWTTIVRDPQAGDVRIAGELYVAEHAERAVVVVHGLGGCYDSFYCRAAARSIHAHGWTALNLALRGADLEGTDYYHGALTPDVHAAVRELATTHDAVHVLGFSVGGHIALHVALESQEARLRSVAAVSAPLDLSAASHYFDTSSHALYRRRVLNACKRVYASVAAKGRVPTPVERVLETRRLRDLDGLTVVPRYGFADTDDYYHSCSVAPHLRRLARPALYIGSVFDPMVPESVVRPYLPGAGGALAVHMIERGGHVGFPGDLDLGYGEKGGVVQQILGFFERA